MESIPGDGDQKVRKTRQSNLSIGSKSTGSNSNSSVSPTSSEDILSGKKMSRKSRIGKNRSSYVPPGYIHAPKPINTPAQKINVLGPQSDSGRVASGVDWNANAITSKSILKKIGANARDSVSKPRQSIK
jgi:hypothetical protein